MMEIAFSHVAVHTVDDLRITWTTEGCDCDGHGFTALEDGGTVSAWQNVRDDVERANFV